MGFIVLNPENVGQFQDASEPTEVRDAMGRIVGFFHPASKMRLDPPFSREDIERQRKLPYGRPLNEILEDLGKK